MRFKSRSVAAFLLGCVIAISAVFLLRESTRYYSYVVVEAPDNLRVTFLQNGRSRAADCESNTASVVSILQSTCLTCRVERQECTSNLTPEQKLLLSSEQLDIPSVLLPDGAVSYSAPNAAYALNACRESEKQSVRTSNRIRCFPAGTTRPLREKGAGPAILGLPAAALAWAAIATLALGSLGFLLLQGRIDISMARLVAWPRRRKQLLMLAVDILSIEATLWLAFALRLEVLYIPQGDSVLLFAFAPIFALPVFWGFGLYRSIIRYLGMQAIVSIVKAVAIYLALLAFALYMVAFEGIPRSTLAIHGVLALLTIGATRAVARSWLQQLRTGFQDGCPRKNVVIYGAGSAGIQLATALAHSKELKPVAFLDDDTRLHRSRMGELDVYSPDHLKDLIARFHVKEVLLAIPSTSRFRRNEIIDLLEPLPVQVRTLPGLSDLVQGKVKTEDLREVDIEDLLGRDPVAPNDDMLKAIIAGKSVMVTGAGGSIGAELCRQILALHPRNLVLYEQNEFSLYNIEQELLGRLQALRSSPLPVKIVALLGSVTNQARLEHVIGTFRVNTIFHAAAYKHVPIVERNPCEGVFNNVFGTYRAAQAAINLGVGTFVLISTDKAVRPTNTMGTTKRFAEMILQALARSSMTGPHRTLFSIVRFGNVLGSSGSVVPLFREQIRRGGPVTVTDPRIVRYFMTIPEATQLVIQAGAMGKDGDVFVLDMGEPVKIVDLAHRMIHLSGLQVKSADQPTGDIEIVFSGLRPGEKLYEELLIGDSGSPTEHPRIMRANEKMLPLETIVAYLDRMDNILLTGDSDEIRALLLEAVEEFEPQCGNEDLVRSNRGLNQASAF